VFRSFIFNVIIHTVQFILSFLLFLRFLPVLHFFSFFLAFFSDYLNMFYNTILSPIISSLDISIFIFKSGSRVYNTHFKFFFFCLFAISRATPTAYGSSQARGLIGAVAAGLRQSHSNVGSKPRLQPTPQLMATLDP